MISKKEIDSLISELHDISWHLAVEVPRHVERIRVIEQKLRYFKAVDQKKKDELTGN